MSAVVFDRILGQQPAVDLLKKALESARVHHAYLFEGPSGVGKELAAFALAQSLVCTAGARLGCGHCSACERAGRLSEEEPRVPLHPDVLLIERGLYPPAVLGESAREITMIGVQQIRKVVLSRMPFPPHEARRLVFIVRAAHELSVSAANALLKTLEEPPPYASFVLLTDRPRELLDTVRSRAMRVRFGPLPESVVAEILRAQGMDTSAAAFADGSAARALELADPQIVTERSAFLSKVQAAVAAPDPAAALDLAREYAKDRETLAEQLHNLAQHLAGQTRAWAEDSRLGERRFAWATDNARAYELVAEALRSVAANAQPTLLLEALLLKLRALPRSAHPPQPTPTATPPA